MDKRRNNLYKKSFAFSLLVIQSYKKLTQEKEFILSKQFLRSGTSIGANVSEANGAISKADFSNKISIAYKECLETQYWLDLLYESQFITKKQYQELYPKADELAKIGRCNQTGW